MSGIEEEPPAFHAARGIDGALTLWQLSPQGARAGGNLPTSNHAEWLSSPQHCTLPVNDAAGGLEPALTLSKVPAGGLAWR